MDTLVTINDKLTLWEGRQIPRIEEKKMASEFNLIDKVRAIASWNRCRDGWYCLMLTAVLGAGGAGAAETNPQTEFANSPKIAR